MKILVISAYYPPHHIGGYELGCRDVVNELRRRQHEVRVLTADYRAAGTTASEEPQVERILLRNQPDRRVNKWTEVQKVLQAAAAFQPDLVFFWSQSELCFWFAPLLRRRGYRTAFFLSDTTFVSWRIGAWLAPAARKSRFVQKIFGNTVLVQGRPVVAGQPCHFASEFLRQVAKKNAIASAPATSAVAHWGIENFPAAPRERWPGRRLLYVGQLIAHKGVHTALAAFAQLAREKEFAGHTFSLAGGSSQPDYERQLRELVARHGLEGRVIFLGQLPRAELPRVYAEHDVLIFPSEWDEPFAITPLEAMAAGLAVVGTTTGGSGELFRDRETALTFRAGDAADCARALRELAADRDLFQTICRQGQREVREKHTLGKMVDVIEQSLRQVAGSV